ncbi:MAG TPA: hypothetical protein VGB13_06175 [Candidatus Krumholzibacteria bacterium]
MVSASPAKTVASVQTAVARVRAVLSSDVDYRERAKAVCEVLRAYEDIWRTDDEPLDPAVCAELFRLQDVASEGLRLIRKLPIAARNLKPIADELLHDDLTQVWHEVVRFVAELVTPDEVVADWLTWRKRAMTAAAKQSAAATMLKVLLVGAGRQWVRARVPALWANGLIEEEQSQFINVLDNAGLLTRALASSLGPLAIERWKLKRRNRDRDREQESGWVPASMFAGNDEVREVFRDLLQPVEIAADARDGNLRPEELGRLSDGVGHDMGTLRRWLRHLSHGMRSSRDYELFEELEQALRYGSSALGFNQRSGSIGLSVPLVRLLHLRAVLEAPSLADAVRRPESAYIPEIVLQVLRHDGASYYPELRIDPDADRRWRARWVESTAEAVATAFLEDVVDLELTSLARIPETTNQETPDFMARTQANEHLVFESKGATRPRTHISQRRKALSQLGKSPDGQRARKGNGRTAIAWGGTSRAFACCLLAAERHDDAHSLLHVADPPFLFDHLFHDGWEDIAMRRHFAAVCEAAGLLDLADHVLAGRPIESEAEQVTTFSLPGGDPERPLQFRGTYREIYDDARRLRHPRAEVFRSVKLFTGIDAGRYEALRRGRLPSAETDSEEDAEPFVRLPIGSGIVPGQGADGAAQGVCSFLSNGSFMAVSARGNRDRARLPRLRRIGRVPGLRPAPPGAFGPSTPTRGKPLDPEPRACGPAVRPSKGDERHDRSQRLPPVRHDRSCEERKWRTSKLYCAITSPSTSTASTGCI